MNMAARLQGCANPGQIVMSPTVHERLTSPPPTAEAHFVVKGVEETVHAHVVAPAPEIARSRTV